MRHYFEKDGLVEEVLEEMVICLDGDEDDSDEEEDEEGLLQVAIGFVSGRF